MKVHDSLTGFPHGDAVEEALSDGVHGAVAAPRSDGGWRVLVWGPDCGYKTERAAMVELGPSSDDYHVWRRTVGPRFVRGTKPGSRTDRALQLLEKHPRMTPHEAAKRVGVESSAVYRAQQRRQRPVCQCCGRAMP